jgi:hypothetical protein
MNCTTCHSKVRPVVALDIDGTMADYHAHFLNFLGTYLGVSEEWWYGYDGSTELSDFLQLDKRTYRDAKLAFRSGGFKRWMPAYPGINDVMEVVEAYDVELWITTTRPWMRLDNIDPDTREWLRRNGISYSGLLFHEDKYEILMETVGLERVVFAFDDQWLQVQQAQALGIPAYLRRTEWNRALPLGPLQLTDLSQAATVIEGKVLAWRGN